MLPTPGIIDYIHHILLFPCLGYVSSIELDVFVVFLIVTTPKLVFYLGKMPCFLLKVTASTAVHVVHSVECINTYFTVPAFDVAWGSSMQHAATYSVECWLKKILASIFHLV